MSYKRLFGLIGNNLSHSFSKDYFDAKFEKENNTDSEFLLFPISDVDLFPQLIKSNPTLQGLSVTIPYKETIIPFLDELNDTAKAVGAVNCIKIERNNNKHRLIGYNTDVHGFKQSIKPFIEKQHERALILGTGGASKAVAYVFKEMGINYYFVTRQSKSGILLPSFNYDELNEYVINAFKLIINTTPIGMFPEINDAPQIPYQFISPSHLMYDLIYNPRETMFLKLGKQHGASTVNGLSMLHQQAEEAWRIWNVSKN